MEMSLEKDCKSRLKVLIFAYYHGLGHISRSVAIGEELQRRGHQVLFACAEEALHIPKKAGLECVKIYELEPLPPQRSSLADEKTAKSINPKPGKSRLASPSYLARTIEEEKALIGKWRPDLVLHDFRITAGISSYLMKVPSFSIHNTNFFIYPLPQIIEELSDSLREIGFASHVVGKIFGDVMFMADISYFDNLTTIPENIRKFIVSSVREISYAGPIIRKLPVLLGEKRSLSQKYSPAGLPLIYITFGGTAMGFDYYVKLLNGISNMKAKFILVTGPNIDPGLLKQDIEAFREKNKESEIEVFRFTDESIEIIKSSDLVIVHGGHTTIMESMYCGTPMIVIPQHEEQYLNAQKAVKLGVAEIVNPLEISGKINDTISRILSKKSVYENCRLVANVLSRTNGVQKIVDHIESDISIYFNQGVDWDLQ